MLNRKQSNKKEETSQSSNIINKDNFQSLPKIYGSIKNKVMENKISFYKNIKRKDKGNLLKSFDHKEIIQQQSKNRKSMVREITHKGRKATKMDKKQSTQKKIGMMKIQQFSDKYHKFQTDSTQKYKRLKTFGDVDDRQSTHRIKFNTIRFLPIVNHGASFEERPADNDSEIREKVSRSVTINNPLVHLYRQKKPKISKNSGSNSQEVTKTPRAASNVPSPSNENQIRLKSRIKTDFGSLSEERSLKKTNLQTEFSRRIQDTKQQSFLIRGNQTKYHIPTSQEYKDFIQSYVPINPSFNLKKLIKQDNFQIISYKDGTYFGLSDCGSKKGEGLLVTEISVFQGIFDNDEKLKGAQQNMDGKYLGAFKNGQREGKGRYEWNNGQIFEGEWKEGKKNGYGVWQSPNGDSYVGYWLNGRQHGKGTHTHKNSVFKGEFLNSLKHGQGEQVFINGDRYKGNYLDGKPHGHGRYEWSDGSYYQGQFVGGYRDGKGILYESDGSTYKGSFKKDFKHGLGQSILKSGDRYEMEYQEGSNLSKRKIKS